MEHSVAAASAYPEVVDVALAVVESGKGLRRVAEGGMGGHVGHHFATNIDLAPIPNRLEVFGSRLQYRVSPMSVCYDSGLA